MNKPKKLISLKEASEMSGYAPDYIGQLIRKGKIEGQQVYHSVAWMTTEEAVRSHMEKQSPVAEKNGAVDAGTGGASAFLRRAINPYKVFRGILYVVIVVVSLFCVLLLYALTASVEQRIAAQAMEKAAHATNSPLQK